MGLSLCDYKAVLFDVDGTLVDSMDMITRGLGDAIERLAGKRPPDHEIRQLIGLPLSVQFKQYASRDLPREELDELISYTISRYEHHHHLERLFEPAIEALRLCHRAGLKTALVTSKNAEEMALFLQRFVAGDAVDANVSASDVARPKPYPDCVLKACELMAVKPSEAVFIGDSIFDMQAARSAGVTPVGAAYGATPPSVLAEEKPAMLLDTPDALLGWARESLLQPTCPERKKI